MSEERNKIVIYENGEIDISKDFPLERAITILRKELIYLKEIEKQKIIENHQKRKRGDSE